MPIDDDVQRIAESRVGLVLKGKYRLDRVLGTGGMASVYVATHRNQKELAIKMLHPELSIRETLRTRFLREGYIANSVKHPGAVAVLDDDVAEDGSAFLVMELLEGAPVDAIWEKHGRRVPLPFALAIADQLLDVLAAAHAKGIVHRDLKPANIFWTNEGRLKVLDFGIARLRDAAGSNNTQTGAMLGTPAFMAPEQALAQASQIDGITDLWAVGATLFVLLSGHLVHEGDNPHQLLILAATRPPRSLASVAPDVPASVVAIVDRAIAFEKANRWPDAASMQAAVRRAHVELFGTEPAGAPRGENSALPEAPRLPEGSRPSLAPTVDAMAQAALPAQPPARAPGAPLPVTTTTGIAAVPSAAMAAASSSPESRPATPAKRAPWLAIGATVVVFAGVGVGVSLFAHSSASGPAHVETITTPSSEPAAAAPVLPNASVAPPIASAPSPSLLASATPPDADAAVAPSAPSSRSSAAPSHHHAPSSAAPPAAPAAPPPPAPTPAPADNPLKMEMK